jgi:hypothetical protein
LTSYQHDRYASINLRKRGARRLFRHAEEFASGACGL